MLNDYLATEKSSKMSSLKRMFTKHTDNIRSGGGVPDVLKRRSSPGWMRVHYHTDLLNMK